MKTDMRKLYLAVLIPHRDMEGALKAQSRFLFAAGLSGARSFPHVVPLGLLSRPLPSAELRALAAAIRAETLKEGRDGRICLGKPILVPCPGLPAFYGPALDLRAQSLSWKPLHPFPLLGLCTALAAPADEDRLGKAGEPPPLSPSWFRAAALANMVLRPLAAGPPPVFPLLETRPPPLAALPPHLSAGSELIWKVCVFQEPNCFWT
jgi:hypothetical protein